MWKPLLAWKPEKDEVLEEKLAGIKFPVLVSTKLDGIRATVQGGQLVSRTLKPIPNKNVREMFKDLPEGLDGELVYGAPNAPDVFRNTTSIVMSDSKPADGIKYYVFDKYDANLGFQRRLLAYQEACDNLVAPLSDCVVTVAQIGAANLEKVLVMEECFTSNGYEGLMIRSMDGRYKEGRSTFNDGILLKVKRFVDSEATILSAYEMEHNDNEAQTNELGRTKRSSAKAGMRAAGVLGGFNVRDIETGVEFSVGSGFDAEQKIAYWNDREALVGKIIKYKYLPVGQKDKPRHPIFLAFRNPIDM